VVLAEDLMQTLLHTGCHLMPCEAKSFGVGQCGSYACVCQQGNS